MVKRIITALIIIGVVIPPLILGGYFLLALVGLIVGASAYEIIKLNANYIHYNKNLVLLYVLILIVSTITPYKYGIIILFSMVLILLAIPVFSKNFNSEDSLFFLGIMMLFYCFARSFMNIHEINPLYIWFIIIATYGCDTGAYFIGYYFGKKKLIPEISPKKTVEGAIGGWFVGMLLSSLFGAFVIKDMNTLLLVLSCLWLPVISQIGDLSFSALKRHFNIKDFSNIFPGHGGFMDRVDSLVFNLIFFYLLMLGIML